MKMFFFVQHRLAISNARSIDVLSVFKFQNITIKSSVNHVFGQSVFVLFCSAIG